MNDANAAKAQRLWTEAGLLIVDLAAERVALRKLADDTRQAVHYSNNQQLREGEHDRPA